MSRPRAGSALLAVLVVAALVPAAGLAGGPVRMSCSTGAKVTLAGKPLDLTGKWTTGGGVYYLRQLGNCVFWTGQSAPTGTWAHVFFGKVAGSSLAGVWSDVPSATIRQNGTLRLKVDPSGTTMTRVAQTGGFGDASWTKSG